MTRQLEPGKIGGLAAAELIGRKVKIRSKDLNSERHGTPCKIHEVNGNQITCTPQGHGKREIYPATDFLPWWSQNPDLQKKRKKISNDDQAIKRAKAAAKNGHHAPQDPAPEAPAEPIPALMRELESTGFDTTAILAAITEEPADFHEPESPAKPAPETPKAARPASPTQATHFSVATGADHRLWMPLLDSWLSAIIDEEEAQAMLAEARANQNTLSARMAAIGITVHKGEELREAPTETEAKKKDDGLRPAHGSVLRLPGHDKLMSKKMIHDSRELHLRMVMRGLDITSHDLAEYKGFAISKSAEFKAAKAADVLHAVDPKHRHFKVIAARNLLLGICFCGQPLKEPVTGPEGGEMGVAGERGTQEVFRCVSGRCFGKKKPRSAPVIG